MSDAEIGALMGLFFAVGMGALLVTSIARVIDNL